MNNKDFKNLKEYAKSQADKNYMEGYINAMIDYKIINTSQAEELIQVNKKECNGYDGATGWRDEG